jgi:hypothetical protein
MQSNTAPGRGSLLPCLPWIFVSIVCKPYYLEAVRLVEGKGLVLLFRVSRAGDVSLIVRRCPPCRPVGTEQGAPHGSAPGNHPPQSMPAGMDSVYSCALDASLPISDIHTKQRDAARKNEEAAYIMTGQDGSPSRGWMGPARAVPHSSFEHETFPSRPSWLEQGAAGRPARADRPLVRHAAEAEPVPRRFSGAKERVTGVHPTMGRISGHRAAGQITDRP